jgi:hypothetical protein
MHGQIPAVAFIEGVPKACEKKEEKRPKKKPTKLATRHP